MEGPGPLSKNKGHKLMLTLLVSESLLESLLPWASWSLQSESTSHLYTILQLCLIGRFKVTWWWPSCKGVLERVAGQSKISPRRLLNSEGVCKTSEELLASSMPLVPSWSYEALGRFWH